MMCILVRKPNSTVCERQQFDGTLNVQPAQAPNTRPVDSVGAPGAKPIGAGRHPRAALNAGAGFAEPREGSNATQFIRPVEKGGNAPIGR